MASDGGTTDHDEIRRWAEERGAQPSRVARRGSDGAGRDAGIIRLDLPGYTGAGALEPITWDEWFRAFDENGLAFIYQDATAGGEQSNFSRLVKRETAAARAGGDSHANARTTGAARRGARE
jgi:hypothetical protein